MTQIEFDTYLSQALPKYAAEKMKGEGLSHEVAMKVAEESFKSLLPKGLDTENQYLFCIIDSNLTKQIGILWYARKKNGSKEHAFIYDIEIDEAFRGKGYGKASLNLLEEEIKKRGLSSIGLHVFGHNKTAIGLYEKHGYQTTNRIMVKNLYS